MARKRQRNIFSARFIFGLLLIFFGTIFMLDRMDYMRVGDIARLWPAILVVTGLGKLVWPGGPSGRFVALCLIVFGGWFLAWEFEYTNLSPVDVWPIIFVLMGIRILWNGLTGPRSDPTGASTVNALAILGAKRRTYHSDDFRGGDLGAFMGGCEVDLRHARIAESPAVIDAFAMWGGVDICVPRDWHVTLEGWPFLGGFEDNTEGLDDDDHEPTQELIVKGTAIMGGVEVKN